MITGLGQRKRDVYKRQGENRQNHAAVCLAHDGGQSAAADVQCGRYTDRGTVSGEGCAGSRGIGIRPYDVSDVYKRQVLMR